MRSVDWLLHDNQAVWDLNNLIKPTLDATAGVFGLRQWRGLPQPADDRVDRFEATNAERAWANLQEHPSRYGPRLPSRASRSLPIDPSRGLCSLSDAPEFLCDVGGIWVVQQSGAHHDNVAVYVRPPAAVLPRDGH